MRSCRPTSASREEQEDEIVSRRKPQDERLPTAPGAAASRRRRRRGRQRDRKRRRRRRRRGGKDRDDGAPREQARKPQAHVTGGSRRATTMPTRRRTRPEARCRCRRSRAELPTMASARSGGAASAAASASRKDGEDRRIDKSAVRTSAAATAAPVEAVAELAAIASRQNCGTSKNRLPTRLLLSRRRSRSSPGSETEEGRRSAVEEFGCRSHRGRRTCSRGRARTTERSEAARAAAKPVMVAAPNGRCSDAGQVSDRRCSSTSRLIAARRSRAAEEQAEEAGRWQRKSFF